MSKDLLSPKDPAEIIAVTLDFTELTTTIQSAVWSVAVLKGTDVNVATMLQGAPSNSGGLTTHLIKNGVSGNLYLVRADVTLASGGKYALAARLPVQTLA